jgi:hypothetical protein
VVVALGDYQSDVAIKSDGAPPRSKTQGEMCASNHGHILECGNALPLSEAPNDWGVTSDS